MAQDQSQALGSPAEVSPAEGPEAETASAVSFPPPTDELPQPRAGEEALNPSQPPPIPRSSRGAEGGQSASKDKSKSEKSKEDRSKADKKAEGEAQPSPRRAARRRPAGPARGQVAANDDGPSIGGLIYALDQKPNSQPFRMAMIASTVWFMVGLVFAWFMISGEMATGAELGTILVRPTTFLFVAAIVVPISVLHFLAVLAWRSDELKLRSSTMTEVAIRLAEPDRMAEQSVASLGQAVRRQVSFMNDAVSRALGRAGELEALVHNEVAALERSYEENERKIRGLIKELSGERDALLNTSERVTDTLRSLGSDIPALIDKLSTQQIKLAQIISGAGDNLTALETAVGQSAIRLETSLSERTDQLQNVLEGYTGALGAALAQNTENLGGLLAHRTDEMQEVLATYTDAIGSALGERTQDMHGMLQSHTSAINETMSSRAIQLQAAIGEYMRTLDGTLANRAGELQAVFEEYGRALDSTLANRSQTMDAQLIERTRALDAAFNERLREFDESIMRSTLAIDTAVSEKALVLTSALESHAKSFSETISRQTADLDDQLIQGINSVRRTSENITRQSLKAIEGLAGQSEMLRSVSENLLSQINSVTNRFENQSQSIMKAANSLESANYKIDVTLQSRHADLARTLDRMSGKADEFGRFVEGYSSTIEGSLTDAENRARATAEQLRIGSEQTARAALADLDRLKSMTDTETERALEDLKRRFSSVSSTVNEQLATLTSRVDSTSDEVRRKATQAAAEIAAEQARLKAEMEHLPSATRENAEQMRRALQDQLRALDQLSNLTQRTAQAREVSPPVRTTPPLHPGLAPEARTGDPAQRRGLSQLTTGDAGMMRTPPRRPIPEPPRTTLPAPSHGGSVSSAGDGREGWSLGDLLARASRDEETHGSVPQGPASGGFQLNVDAIARALDPVTAAALWARIRSGQRGVMVRSIYTNEGRLVFDDVSRRYRSDVDIKRTIDRYLGDFERIRAEADERDPSGRLTEKHIASDSGRVFLFLAHASGRFA